MKRLVCTITLLMAVGLAGARGQQLTEPEKRALEEANKFVERGNKFVQENSLARAKAEYAKALKIFPRHLDALYNQAVVCEKLQDPDAATALYKEYLKMRPEDADVWTQLGVRHDEAGRVAEARAAYEKALAINPKFGRALHNLGVLLETQGKFGEALEYLEKFISVEEAAGRHTGDAYYSLGALMLRLGKIRDAKVLLQQALDCDPNIPYYNNAMGDVYLAEKAPDLAINAYKKAIEKDAKYAPAHCGLGDAYRQMNDQPKAAAAYAKALELRPDYVLVHFRLGLLYEASAPDQATKHFEKYLASGKNLEFAKQAKDRIEALKQAKQPETKK
jgi:tetratricopeptide (TPR) repeat protein